MRLEPTDRFRVIGDNVYIDGELVALIVIPSGFKRDELVKHLEDHGGTKCSGV
jgi:hypothetical protein